MQKGSDGLHFLAFVILYDDIGNHKLLTGLNRCFCGPGVSAHLNIIPLPQGLIETSQDMVEVYKNEINQ
jgi:hypothetical protein